MAKILLVDDDVQSLESTRKILEFSGYEVITATDGQDALEKVRPSLQAESEAVNSPYDLVITDVRMPRMGGLEFLRALSICGDSIPVILMTAYGRVEDAVWAMKLGAVDFLTKPFKRHALLSTVDSVLKRVRVQSPGLQPSVVFAESDLHPLVGSSEQMLRLKENIERVAPTVATVLITGESGTGKELVARCIHQKSARTKGPWIAINCAAVPENLIESELFGYEKGSFTGALSSRTGLFESAHGGTLLLDEVGDMPLSLQAKLLRVLQEGEVRRVGSVLSKKVDVRIIASTHRNLKEAVKNGTFREDLLYRLEVVVLEVPALRDRMRDLPELVGAFIKQSCQRHGKKIFSVHPEALDILLQHTWPGNVRELFNVIERAVVFSNSSELLPQDIPPHLRMGAQNRSSLLSQEVGARNIIEVPLGTPLNQVEDLLIRKTLEATEGDKNMTAKILGVNTRTITRKLEKRS